MYKGCLEMRRIDECDMDKFGALVIDTEKTIAILGDRWWPQTAKQQGDKISKKFLCNIWEKKTQRRAPKCRRCLLGVGTVLGTVLRSNGMHDQWSKDYGKQRTSTPPPRPLSSICKKIRLKNSS